jgi:uncharacterized protein
VPKKSARRRRSSRSSVAVLAFAAVAAVLFALWFLAPRHGGRAPGVAFATATPAQTLAPAPVEPSESPVPQSTQTPAAAPSASATALPAVTPRAAASGQTPKLALIVDDCGQWLDTERGFIALDVPLTLSVLPDVHYTSLIAREAGEAGKGVMLHLPMDTVSGMNPGPGKVTTEMSDAEITAQVENDLAQIPLARGVNNHEGSKGSADRRVMNDVIGVLAKHGDLFFIDSRTSADSVGEATARAGGVPTAGRDVFLDNREDVDYTEGQLREAAAIAIRTGSAIAIGHPRPTTLAAVKAMIPDLQAQGIEFVLAGDLVSR